MKRTVDLVRVLRAIPLIEGRQRRRACFTVTAGFNRPTTRRKLVRASSAVAESGKLERFFRPDLGYRIRSRPACRHIGKNADDGVSGPVQCDTAADHVWIAAEPFLPEIPRDERYVRALFFLRQEITSPNRLNSQNIKVVRGQSTAEDLDRITQPGQSKGREIFTGQTVENSLAIPEVLITRRRQREVHQIARLVATEQVDDTRWLLKGKAAQKKIVDQTEDRRVQANPQCERYNGDGSEGRVTGGVYEERIECRS